MQTHCSRCHAAMICGVNETSCWCQALPALPTSQYRPVSGCLCAACLQAELAAGADSGDTAMPTLYGIANCDTVKKSRLWLADHAIAYTFWDYKNRGVPADQLPQWLAMLGWERVVNTRGTAWRGLPDAVKARVVDAASAQALLADPANASVIKRPIVAWGSTYGGAVTLGFDAALWAQTLKISV